jgi:hypothetical protein
MSRSHLLFLLFLLSGCSTQSSLQVVAARSLAGNPRLPGSVIAHFYTGSGWDTVKNLPYDAFVILRGDIQPDRHIKISRIVESFPDDSRIALAREYSRHARITPVTVGTHVHPMAEVYVIFYDTAPGRRQALVFADQVGNPAATDSFGGRGYLYIVYY